MIDTSTVAAPRVSTTPFGPAGCLSRWERLQYLVCVYHLRPWAYKTGARPLAYILFAYALARQGSWITLLVNALAGVGVFMFAGAFDDYWDYQVRGERNCVGQQISEGRWRMRTAQTVAWIPLLMVIPLLLAAPRLQLSVWTIGSVLLLAMALLLSYSIPPLRLKDRAPWGFFVGPCLASLLFFESWRVVHPPTTLLVLMTIHIFGFQCYAEAMHVIDNHVVGIRRMSSLPLAQAMRWFRWLPRIGLIGALGASLIHPLLLITACCSAVRWVASRALTVQQIGSVRRKLWSPVWSLYEFLAYAGVGIWFGIG